MLQPVLCGWYVYMAVLALLLALSAGPASRGGRLALLALVAAILANVMTWRPLPWTWSVAWPPLAGVNLLRLLPDLADFLVGAGLLLFHRRQDTRLIALLLAGAALFPMALFFWRP